MRKITDSKAAHAKWSIELTPEDQLYADELRAASVPQLTFFRDLRKAVGLTQLEVADLLQTTQSNVSKIERSGDLSLSSILKMARARNDRVRITIESEDGVPRAVFAFP